MAMSNSTKYSTLNQLVVSVSLNLADFFSYEGCIGVSYTNSILSLTLKSNFYFFTKCASNNCFLNINIYKKIFMNKYLQMNDFQYDW